ncbi:MULTISPECIES: MOSC domain-containing protein [Sulfurimonas]|uniref:MOSC domain-containing protein n=1 Tax=Sulfurimonas TaxID=202746 RepID=UPI0012648B95|nr:MOSC domain-containing protein [Sulfurimonas indica]
MQGKVVALYITKNDADKTRERPSIIDLDENGIIGDKFYAKDMQRAILITATDSYKLAKENGIDITEGSLGENLLIDINPYHLLPGERLSVGDTLLEITQNCTLCKGLSTLNSQLPKLLKDDRGIFAKVVNGPHRIKTGDEVKIQTY